MMNNKEIELEIEDYIEDVASVFKILGDVTRVKILNILIQGEANVSSIAELVNLPISAISHQLRILRQAKLIKPRKQGKEVFYAYDDDHILNLFSSALEHVKEF